MSRHGVLCIFVKEPIPGRAKTRLAASIGPDAAALLATAFLADTLALLDTRTARSRLVLAVEPATYVPPAAESIDRWPQGEGGLGDRLERAAARALEDAPWVLFLGTDSPGLPRAYLEEAVDRLEDPLGPAAVIGPSRDGGYYALGIRRLPAGALRGIRWSSLHARADTVAALQRVGLRTAELPDWFDVDEGDDLIPLLAHLRDGTITAPATARALAALGYAVSSEGAAAPRTSA